MTMRQRSADRRIRRTRQTLHEAFQDILREKGNAAVGVWGIAQGFQAMSIHDITERANVNRGTFYLHFADKYSLAESVMREQFHQMVASVLPASVGWNRETLRLLVGTMLDSFEHKYRHQQRASSVLVSLLERVTQEELTGLLHRWLSERKDAAPHQALPVGAVASIASWAIFGAALQWSREERVVSKEEMTLAILQVVMDGTTCLTPDGL